jgi:DNA-directed RNA polymerase subunit H
MLLSREGGFEVSTRLNVLDHTMVPDHQIMNEEEIAGLFSIYNISSEQLPKMYQDDPAAKTIGAKPGDVVRIIRISHTAGRAESYRLVIKRPKK